MRADRLCGGCYDLRQAESAGMSYGKYIAAFGHNLGRPGEAAPRPVRVCANCGAPVPPRSRRFCSPACGKKYWSAYRLDVLPQGGRKGGVDNL